MSRIDIRGKQINEDEENSNLTNNDAINTTISSASIIKKGEDQNEENKDNQ